MQKTAKNKKIPPKRIPAGRLGMKDCVHNSKEQGKNKKNNNIIIIILTHYSLTTQHTGNFPLAVQRKKILCFIVNF